MSADTPNKDTATDQPDGDVSDGSGDIKALRKAAEGAKAAQAENDQLKRELAFAKAGVDTDSKLGSMLFKTYEGDLADVAALKAEWAELAPAPAEAKETAPETAPTPEGFQDPAQMQQHREQITGDGAAAGATPSPGPHPVDAALEAFHANGALPLEARQTEALGQVLGAYFQGDKRVMFDRPAHLAAAQSNASEDMFPEG